jgi:hypothetical protein
MDLRRYHTHLTLIGLMALTSFALAFTVDVSLVDKAGINRALPERVNDWIGEDLLFCQRASCGKAWTHEELAGITNRCPTCLFTNLYTCSEIERRMLPADTDIRKKRYRNPITRDTYHASYVLSGKERVSIHRPEQCLSGAGNKISGQRFIDVDMPGRDPLRVKILEMENETLGDDGKSLKYTSFYAYWFVGSGGRETANHYARMFYMSWDRIFRNQAHRWAYLSVSGLRDTGAKSEDYIAPLKAFIADYYPPQLVGVE